MVKIQVLELLEEVDEKITLAEYNFIWIHYDKDERESSGPKNIFCGRCHCKTSIF